AVPFFEESPSLSLAQSTSEKGVPAKRKKLSPSTGYSRPFDKPNSMESEAEAQQFVCSECGKICSSGAGLSKHFTIHFGQ
ncbi:hypothetical protein PMAYCL1PPCAC_01526, partial [Pristionchus mayeri]